MNANAKGVASGSSSSSSSSSSACSVVDLSWIDNIPEVDDLIKEYLIFRGYHKTHDTFLRERKKDKTHGYQIQLIVDQLLLYLKQLKLDSYLDFWSTLERRIFSKLPPQYREAIFHLDTALKKYFLITARKKGSMESINLFFKKFASDLLSRPDAHDWMKWFTLPHIAHPEKHAEFEAYFNKHWIFSVQISLRNFLSTALCRFPRPKLLAFQVLKEERIQMKKEIQQLKERLKDADFMIRSLQHQFKSNLGGSNKHPVMQAIRMYQMGLSVSGLQFSPKMNARNMHHQHSQDCSHGGITNDELLLPTSNPALQIDERYFRTSISHHSSPSGVHPIPPSTIASKNSKHKPNPYHNSNNPNNHHNRNNTVIVNTTKTKAAHAHAHAHSQSVSTQAQSQSQSQAQKNKQNLIHLSKKPSEQQPQSPQKLCRWNCGHPINPGLQRNGKPYTTCCQLCNERNDAQPHSKQCMARYKKFLIRQQLIVHESESVANTNTMADTALAGSEQPQQQQSAHRKSNEHSDDNQNDHHSHSQATNGGTGEAIVRASSLHSDIRSARGSDQQKNKKKTASSSANVKTILVGSGGEDGLRRTQSLTNGERKQLTKQQLKELKQREKLLKNGNPPSKSSGFKLSKWFKLTGSRSSPKHNLRQNSGSKNSNRLSPVNSSGSRVGGTTNNFNTGNHKMLSVSPLILPATQQQQQSQPQLQRQQQQQQQQQQQMQPSSIHPNHHSDLLPSGGMTQSMKTTVFPSAAFDDRTAVFLKKFNVGMPLTHVQFSLDGDFLAYACDDGVVHIFRFPNITTQQQSHSDADDDEINQTTTTMTNASTGATDTESSSTASAFSPSAKLMSRSRGSLEANAGLFPRLNTQQQPRNDNSAENENENEFEIEIGNGSNINLDINLQLHANIALRDDVNEKPKSIVDIGIANVNNDSKDAESQDYHHSVDGESPQPLNFIQPSVRANPHKNTIKVSPVLIHTFRIPHPIKIVQLCWDPCSNHILMVATTNQEIEIWNVISRQRESIISCINHECPNIRYIACNPSYTNLNHSEENMFQYMIVSGYQLLLSSANPENTNNIPNHANTSHETRNPYKSVLYLYHRKKYNLISKSLSINNTLITCIEYNHNGRLIIVGGNDGYIRLFDIQNNTFTQISIWMAHVHHISRIYLCDDANSMLTIGGGSDLVVKLWDLHKQNVCKQMWTFNNTLQQSNRAHANHNHNHNHNNRRTTMNGNNNSSLLSLGANNYFSICQEFTNADGNGNSLYNIVLQNMMNDEMNFFVTEHHIPQITDMHWHRYSKLLVICSVDGSVRIFQINL